VPVIWFADCGVERFVVHMEDPSPLLSSNLRGCGEPLSQEFLDKVVDLLAMSDARERAVLAADEYSGVQHDRDEEAGLTIGETERRDRVNAASVELGDVPSVRRLNFHALR
jgi:hypothetical protein